MKTGSWEIPLNCSIIIPVWRSMKRDILMLHEKHNIENKWLDRVRNKSTSIER